MHALNLLYIYNLARRAHLATLLEEYINLDISMYDIVISIWITIRNVKARPPSAQLVVQLVPTQAAWVGAEAEQTRDNEAHRYHDE